MATYTIVQINGDFLDDLRREDFGNRLAWAISTGDPDILTEGCIRGVKIIGTSMDPVTMPLAHNKAR